ncbi:MAG: mechanosensitive ion channel family protein [Treponema sp.]|jgi:small conductance mechanosensitive channel|nr:mechanosensitive ion channel family protein [Treponema sp.]
MNEKILAFWNAHYTGIIELGRDLIVTVVIVIAGRVLTRGAVKLINRAAADTLQVDETIASLLRLIIRYGIFIVCLIMILNTFGINTASLLAILGAAGVAIGLALKDTLSNIAAGLILLFLRSYHKGDYIEFGSYSGTVKEISLFTTTLETPDGIYVSAPNSGIWGTILKNYTRNGRRRMDLSIGISYSDSIDAAFRVMSEIAAAESRFMKTPAPQIVVQSLGESSVNIVLRAWAGVDVYWSIYSDQMKNIKEKFDEAGLRIPFPRRELHVYTEKNLHE